MTSLSRQTHNAIVDERANGRELLLRGTGIDAMQLPQRDLFDAKPLAAA